MWGGSVYHSGSLWTPLQPLSRCLSVPVPRGLNSRPQNLQADGFGLRGPRAAPPPSLTGWQRSCGNSVVVLCVIKLLKTKIRIQVPAWWDRGVPVGLVAVPTRTWSGSSWESQVLLSAWFRVVATPALKVLVTAFSTSSIRAPRGAPCSHYGCLAHAFLEQDQ